jgi:DNA-binding NtrC family response regulator/tetratricopeptide (TPR) repeat protein
MPHMELIESVRALARSGRFLEALETLETCRLGHDKMVADLLRVELYERTGRAEESQALALRLLKSRDLGPSEKAICEFTLGQIAWETKGDTDKSIVHVQRAVALADQGKDRRKVCLFRLRQMVMVADKSGPTSVLPILSQLRSQSIKLGDPHISAALHIFIGETEAKKGLVRSAARHAILAQSVLSLEPNLWLECHVQNILVANAIMTSDREAGLLAADRALALAKESGAASMLRACFANLGNILYLSGQFESAITSFESALSALPSTSDRANGCYDGLARVFLTQNEFSDADRFLVKIEESIRNASDWLLYGNRQSRLTRTEWMLRQGRKDDASRCLDHVMDLATRSGDHVLLSQALVGRAHIMTLSGEEAAPLLATLAEDLQNCPPDVQARYETVVGFALARSGRVNEAERHFRRAENVCEAIGNLPALIEARRAKLVAEMRIGTSGDSSEGMQTAIPTRSTVSNAIQNISSLLLHVGRPNLLAVDLVSILIDAHVVTSARATSRSPEGSTEILASYLCSDSLDGPKQVIEIGTTTGRCVQVTLQPLPDAESRATVSALALILSAVRDLERAKMEREERLALWPLEEELDDDGNGVIIGHMRELMLFAKKIAKTSINVLLTGESGTGKEILARAIHKYSARADKPFMPFNCTAVPRDMLESQLFGHRRGAFTSADRDNPGLIRAAKGGTLFLDEIGELSLDLQPKLLRFLESGEISPLGEAGPLNVDVRVIAATNRDLEELVREGRFREDLFYRLNVIRLSILPLRERRDEVPALIHHFVSRSAQDLGKGQLRVAEETMERFLLYPWPGNVRQMQNEIRRIVALADVDGVLTADMLSADIRKTGPRASATRKDGLEMNVPLTDKLSPTLAHVEREMIRLALKKTHGRLDAAARSLGISRKGLYLKRQRLGL